MTIEHHPVKTCGQVGHIINISFTVRCLHREEIWHSERTYVDDANDSPAMLYDGHLEFGPFDDLAEMIEAIERSQGRGLEALQLYIK